MTDSDAELWKAVSEEGLCFFGAMCAAVSHEIRNKLAVINEKAGLVEDIAFAMKTGRPIDPNRLEVQAGKIKDQVGQANSIVGALNRLGHSVDEARTRVEISSLVSLAAELYGRKASQAEIAIDTTGLTPGVSVATNPFPLVNLIGACVDAALPRVDASRTLAIASESMDRGAIIRFGNLEGIEDAIAKPGGEDPGVQALLVMLGGRVDADCLLGEFVLEISDCGGGEEGSHP